LGDNFAARQNATVVSPRTLIFVFCRGVELLFQIIGAGHQLARGDLVRRGAVITKFADPQSTF